MKKTIFTILIILMMASNALAYCGAFATNAVVLGVAPSLEAVTAAYTEITDVASYFSENSEPYADYRRAEIGEPDCTQKYEQLIGDINKKFQIMFDSPIPNYQNSFYDANTNVVTTVAAFNGDPGSISVVSVDFDTYEFVFKYNYEWTGNAITFTGATYDETTQYTTISANTQDTGTDVAIILAIDNTGTEVYTTQIEIDGNNIKSGCIEIINNVLVMCTQVDGYSGATTINKENGAVISTVVVPVHVDPLPHFDEDTAYETFFMLPTVDVADDMLILQKFTIAPNGAITPIASKYTSLDATWDSVTGIKILSASTTAVYGITDDGLTSYPTISVYNTLTNTQIFGYRIQNENAVIAGVAVTDDGDIAVAATDELLQETNVYLFDSTGFLLNSGKVPQFGAEDMGTIYLVSPNGEGIVLVGMYDAQPTSVEIDPATFDATMQTQDITANIGGVITPNNFKVQRIEVLSGSFGIQIYGYNNANVPEFSTTTMLLATLLAGGLVLFVVRRRK